MAGYVNAFLDRFRLLAGTVLLTVLAGGAIADIENTATAQAIYGVTPLASAPSTQSVRVSESAPNVRLTKTIDRVEDTNDNGVTDAGDTVFYTFEVLNDGNLTLEQIELHDPLADITVATLGPLLPTASDTTLTASYILKQDDINAGGFENSATVKAVLPDDDNGTPRDPILDVSDAGDETIETVNLAGEIDNDPTNDPTVLRIEGISELELAKSVVSVDNVFPFVYDVAYEFAVTNTGTVTARNVQVADDLFNQLTQARVVSVQTTEIAGFIDENKLNDRYDGNEQGAGDAGLLGENFLLAPGATGRVKLLIRLEFAAESFVETPLTLENQAIVTASGVLGARGSYDPTVPSPGQVAAPTVTQLLDSDADGALDRDESTTGDHDGDGIANAYDYDPTGYFYCEETGEILTGGRVSVVDANGSAANIRMISDGSDGYFQWYAVAPGTYTMSYEIPPSTTMTVDRPVNPSPLVLATLAGKQVYFGSNEAGNTGRLADFTYVGNPYYQTFVIAENDPHVLNINIPVRLCSTPELAVTKVVSGEPVVLATRQTELTYEMTLSNTSATRADNVNLSDDLAAVFGADRFEITELQLVSKPEDFVGLINPDFNGDSDTSLLSGNAGLGSQDSITVSMSLIVDPAKTDTYTNTVVASGVSPFDGSQVKAVEAKADVELTKVDLRDVLLISKSANPSRARVGDVVTFTITVENTDDSELLNLNLIDSLPQGLAYRPGTATLRGVAKDPSVNGLTLSWRDLQLDAGETVVATLQATLTSRAEVGVMTNQTWMADTDSGERMTRIAEATVELIAEAIFNCSDVIGNVFDDRNMNGYQDDGMGLRVLPQTRQYDDGTVDIDIATAPEGAEEGIANVRLVTPTGTVITTDAFGRYSVPCAELPQRAGSNFSLKLDPRSLPSGYRVTTENPRTMRVTPGIFTEMNFGAATGRVLEIDLTAAAFTSRGEPSEALVSGLDQMLRRAVDAPSVVRLNYYRDTEGSRVARNRLDAVETLIEELWKDIGNYDLMIDRAITRFE